MTENTRRRNTCWDITLNQENKNILFLNPVEPTKMQACVFLPRREGKVKTVTGLKAI